MATDIRRMNKEELDELNRQGAIWRARNKPAQPVTDTIPDPPQDRRENPHPDVDDRRTTPPFLNTKTSLLICCLFLCAVLNVEARIGSRRRAVGITIYLENDGRLEHAQQMAGHESPRTTKL
jgi:hypothetical protein